MNLRATTIAEFVRRMIERSGPGQWMLLVTPPDKLSQIAEQVAFGVAQEAEPGEMPDVVRPENANALVDAVMRHPHAVVVGTHDWPAAEWARLDTLRSRLLCAQRVAFVVSDRGAAHLFTVAPHFARFFTGSAWRAVLDAELMGEEERRARMADLEAWSGWSTAETIRRAEARDLPSDPEYAEWLALAGRSDLL